jgi:hypothetical protein
MSTRTSQRSAADADATLSIPLEAACPDLSQASSEPRTVRPELNSPVVPLDRLAAREGRLWLLAVIVLVSLAIGLALVSWQPVGLLPWRLDALPIGLVLLVGLFGAYGI